MRVKTLERDGSRKVLLVYPTTLDEYRQALETLGRHVRADGERRGRRAGPDPRRTGHRRAQERGRVEEDPTSPATNDSTGTASSSTGPRTVVRKARTTRTMTWKRHQKTG